MGLSRLVCPSAELQAQYMDFYRDWIDSGENIVPWVVEKDRLTDFGLRFRGRHDGNGYSQPLIGKQYMHPIAILPRSNKVDGP